MGFWLLITRGDEFRIASCLVWTNHHLSEDEERGLNDFRLLFNEALFALRRQLALGNGSSLSGPRKGMNGYGSIVKVAREEGLMINILGMMLAPVIPLRLMDDMIQGSRAPE